MISYQSTNGETDLLPSGAVIADLGRRVEAYRLSRNLRQSDICKMAGLSPSTLVRLEQGKGGTIDTLVRVLQAFGVADRLSLVVPDARLNPLDPLSATGRSRKRARPESEESAKDDWVWGDDI